jgi:23S rRNA pseudouridine2605 synthase
LNKYLAQAGVASRRKADELIKAGRVTIEGKTITELGLLFKKNPKVLKWMVLP